MAKRRKLAKSEMGIFAEEGPAVVVCENNKSSMGAAKMDPSIFFDFFWLEL
jgi:hypothetical protein